MAEIRDRRNLPGPVLNRLAQGGLADRAGVQIRARVVEERRFTLELRAKDDGGRSLAGYASTFDQPYPVMGGAASGWGWDEVIASGAFDKSLAEQDDVRLLINHDGVPLARTKSGTLELRSDKVGLLAHVPSLDMASPDVQRVVSAMDRGDMDQMSFAFEVTKQDWSPDYSVRTIREVKLYDVSVVTYPANEATMALLDSADPPAEERHHEPVETRGGISLTLARAQLDAYRASRGERVPA